MDKKNEYPFNKKMHVKKILLKKNYEEYSNSFLKKKYKLMKRLPHLITVIKNYFFFGS